MHKFPETTPPENTPIIVYTKDKQFCFAVYRRELTWKGYKLKFVNLMSSGLWVEDSEVEGWNRIPHRNITI